MACEERGVENSNIINYYMLRLAAYQEIITISKVRPVYVRLTGLKLVAEEQRLLSD